ncbi:hypothetical protein BC629DRAFT_1482038 [Irpex lacteus]|nr:hypothetical protein BC629DRAFT_1482038 [Irpex lacteus]
MTPPALCLTTSRSRDTSPGIKKPLYTTMVCIAGLTYAIATAHWGIAFAWMQKTLVSPSEQHALLQAIEIGGRPCSLPVPSLIDLEGDDLYTMNLLPMPSCVETVLLTASIALSTSIVLLRVLLLWSKSFSLLAIVVVSLLTLLASSCWNALRTSSPCFSTDPALSCFFCDVPGIVVLCISGALNVLPILFTGYKLWCVFDSLQTCCIRVDCTMLRCITGL